MIHSRSLVSRVSGLKREPFCAYLCRFLRTVPVLPGEAATDRTAQPAGSLPVDEPLRIGVFRLLFVINRRTVDGDRLIERSGFPARSAGKRRGATPESSRTLGGTPPQSSAAGHGVPPATAAAQIERVARIGCGSAIRLSFQCNQSTRTHRIYCFHLEMQPFFVRSEIVATLLVTLRNPDADLVRFDTSIQCV